MPLLETSSIVLLIATSPTHCGPLWLSVPTLFMLLEIFCILKDVAVKDHDWPCFHMPGSPLKFSWVLVLLSLCFPLFLSSLHLENLCIPYLKCLTFVHSRCLPFSILHKFCAFHKPSSAKQPLQIFFLSLTVVSEALKTFCFPLKWLKCRMHWDA